MHHLTPESNCALITRLSGPEQQLALRARNNRIFLAWQKNLEVAHYFEPLWQWKQYQKCHKSLKAAISCASFDAPMAHFSACTFLFLCNSYILLQSHSHTHTTARSQAHRNSLWRYVAQNYVLKMAEFGHDWWEILHQCAAKEDCSGSDLDIFITCFFSLSPKQELQLQRGKLGPLIWCTKIASSWC